MRNVLLNAVKYLYLLLPCFHIEKRTEQFGCSGNASDLFWKFSRSDLGVNTKLSLLRFFIRDYPRSIKANTGIVP
jgi:hypothetical protein